MMKYPPYTDLCMFGFLGPEEESEVKQAAMRFLKMLENAVTGEYKELPVIVLDPTPRLGGQVAGNTGIKS